MVRWALQRARHRLAFGLRGTVWVVAERRGLLGGGGRARAVLSRPPGRRRAGACCAWCGREGTLWVQRKLRARGKTERFCVFQLSGAKRGSSERVRMAVRTVDYH